MIAFDRACAALQFWMVEAQHQAAPEIAAHAARRVVRMARACHCEHCHEPLELDPVHGLVFASCGNCCGGGELDGETFRGGESQAFERESQAQIQRELK